MTEELLAEIKVLKEQLKAYKDIEEEYAIQDTTDLRRRLDLADKYAELSEQLGIDLITLFKALKNGVYTRQYRKVDVCCIGLGGLLIEVNEDLKDTYYYCEYGKTWALTKEELEK